MNDSLFLIFFLGSSLFFSLGFLAAGLAWSKGYRPWFWLASLGPVGAWLMLRQPTLSRATTPEEREQWEQRANWTGGILSGITLFVALAMPIFGVMAFMSLRATVVVGPPPKIAVPAPPLVEESSVAEPPTSPSETPDATKPENLEEATIIEIDN